METSNKKLRNNIIMIVVIALIAVAGIVFVGMTKGWFDDANSAISESKFGYLHKGSGIVNVERDGVSFEADKDTLLLKKGDVITTADGAFAEIKAGENSYEMNSATKIKIDSLEQDSIKMTLLAGEVFAYVKDGSAFGGINMKDWTFNTDNSVFSADVFDISMNVRVLSGVVSGLSGDEDVKGDSGEVIMFTEKDRAVTKLTVDSLNDFNLENALNISKNNKLCFTSDEMKAVVDGRKAEEGKTEGAVVDVDGNVEIPESTTTKLTDKEEVSTTNKNSETTKKDSGTTTKKTSESGQVSTTKPTTTKPTTTKPTTQEQDYKSCTIEIRCDSILSNMDKFPANKASYVPSNGTILAKTTVQFNEGESVLDILKRACSSFDIQLAYDDSPMISGGYVKSIGNIAEKDCGLESGWKYKVNGWAPNYGCNSYKVKEGDAIVWYYACSAMD